uniref:Uncharacterized protein n=1 Tax=Knipowitschia caucasica TaxID=637954 RepID=A0AAV2KTZ0_KNICA
MSKHGGRAGVSLDTDLGSNRRFGLGVTADVRGVPLWLVRFVIGSARCGQQQEAGPADLRAPLWSVLSRTQIGLRLLNSASSSALCRTLVPLRSRPDPIEEAQSQHQ